MNRRSRCLLVLALLACGSRAWADSDDPEDAAADVQSIVVTATRSRHLVRDQAIRVEVVPQEELEESQTVAPGNLTNLLNELAGARIASGAPGLGGADLELRGLPGRFSRVLTDGLPLTGGPADSFGLLQAPPIDLARVELIKGPASALYGGSALAGVMNLVSRGPGSGSALLLNQTSLGGSDLAFFHGGSARPEGATTLSGAATYQERRDRDGDGWAEIPGYRRFFVRPRWFSHDADGDSLFGTLSVMSEHRSGGTMPSDQLAAESAFPEALDTTRVDGGVAARYALGEFRAVDAKFSAVAARHERRFGDSRETDIERTFSGAVSLQDRRGAHDWVIGAALEWQQLDTGEAPGLGYRYVVPAVFAQDEFDPAPWVSLTGSARVDVHDELGTFVSPRLSALFRLGEEVSLRASLGSGFAAPTPLIDAVQEIGLSRVEPVRGLRPEQAQSASLDLSWRPAPFDINLSAFATDVSHPLLVRRAVDPARVEVVNAAGPLEVRGAELLVGITAGPAHVLVNATHLDATEVGPGGTRTARDQVPRWTAEVAAIFEDEERGRAGFEVSYTGAQRLEDDPYLDQGHDFVEVNALAELRLGKWAIFANALDITDVRQRDYAPLLRPVGESGLGGSPITSAWAPLAGRSFNVGVRLRL
jgi:outer membrane receptor for ferrienterochelin and colicins